jgi:lysozyme
MNIPKLKEQLILHEGLKLKPYTDTVGVLTIGVGRNLDHVGVSEAEAHFLLDNDVAKAINELDRKLPWWKDLDDVRQRVLADMMFNLGLPRLLGFEQALTAMRQGRFDDAAYEMQNSKWFHQVGSRGVRLVRMMRTGKDEL